MSYEYSSSPGNQRFSPPNPLKIENYFVAAAGAFMMLMGIALLLALRDSVNEGNMGNTFGGLVIGAIMVGIGATASGLMASHLRFWFGRERPNNLTNGKFISEIMRQRALAFPEPKGALNGLLYSWIPDLIFSPVPLQHMAQRQFRNALTMAALLVSLCVALIGGKVGVGEVVWGRVSDWVGLIYLIIAGYLLLGKIGFGAISEAQPGLLQRNGLIFLIVFSIIGPLLMSLVATILPPITWLSPYPHIFLFLVTAVCIYTLLLFAILRQTNAAPPTEVSMEQQAWSINCQPGLVMGEFDRFMQDNWRDKIPNRVYWHGVPEIDMRQSAGKFSGGGIEETQPYMAMRQPLDFKAALGNPRHKLLIALDTVGAFCFLVSAIALFLYGNSVGHSGSSSTTLLYGFSFVFLGSYAFRAAHRLWKRFDFESRIVWIEMEGNYVSARMDHGNVMNDTVKTSSSVVQIESMTFRVWIAAFDTVTFGVDTERYVVATRGEPEVVHNLIRHLHEFALNQAIVVSPTSRTDIERHTALGLMNQLSRSSEGLANSTTDAQKLILSGTIPTSNDKPEGSEMAVLPSASENAVSRAAFCSGCGKPATQAASFCGFCGIRLQSV